MVEEKEKKQLSDLTNAIIESILKGVRPAEMEYAEFKYWRKRVEFLKRNYLKGRQFFDSKMNGIYKKSTKNK